MLRGRIANCKIIRKKQAHFFTGDTFICGVFGGILRKMRKRGFCLIIPKKGAFLSDFVRFWGMLIRLGFGIVEFCGTLRILSVFVGFELKAKKALKRAF